MRTTEHRTAPHRTADDSTWVCFPRRLVAFSLTTFSPSGKLIQIEHALAAVGQGTTSLGIKGELRRRQRRERRRVGQGSCGDQNGLVERSLSWRHVHAFARALSA